MGIREDLKIKNLIGEYIILKIRVGVNIENAKLFDKCKKTKNILIQIRQK